MEKRYPRELERHPQELLVSEFKVENAFPAYRTVYPALTISFNIRNLILGTVARIKDIAFLLLYAEFMRLIILLAVLRCILNHGRDGHLIQRLQNQGVEKLRVVQGRFLRFRMKR